MLDTHIEQKNSFYVYSNICAIVLEEPIFGIAQTGKNNLESCKKDWSFISDHKSVQV